MSLYTLQRWACGCQGCGTPACQDRGQRHPSSGTRIRGPASHGQNAAGRPLRPLPAPPPPEGGRLSPCRADIHGSCAFGCCARLSAALSSPKGAPRPPESHSPEYAGSGGPPRLSPHPVSRGGQAPCLPSWPPLRRQYCRGR